MSVSNVPNAGEDFPAAHALFEDLVQYEAQEYGGDLFADLQLLEPVTTTMEEVAIQEVPGDQSLTTPEVSPLPPVAEEERVSPPVAGPAPASDEIVVTDWDLKVEAKAKEEMGLDFTIRSLVGWTAGAVKGYCTGLGLSQDQKLFALRESQRMYRRDIDRRYRKRNKLLKEQGLVTPSQKPRSKKRGARRSACTLCGVVPICPCTKRLRKDVGTQT